MGTKNTGLDHVLARLESMLKEVWDQRPADLLVDSDASLVSLGVDSLTLVLLLDKVEYEFHIDWDAENSPCAVSSLRSIAELVVRRNFDSSTEAKGEQCERRVPT